MNPFEFGYDGGLYARRRLARRRRRIVLGLTAGVAGLAALLLATPGEKTSEPPPAAAMLAYDVVEPRTMTLPDTLTVDRAIETPLAGTTGTSMPPPPIIPRDAMRLPAIEAAPLEAVETAPSDVASSPPPSPPPEIATPPANPPAATPPPAAPASSSKPAAATPGARVQLAAVRSETDAHRAWRQLKKAQPDLLGPLEPVVHRATADKGGTVWRVQAALVSDVRARHLCRELQRRRVDCFVVGR